MVNSAIERYLGHIQIHTKKFQDDRQIGYDLKNLEALRKIIGAQDSILAFSERTIIEGMAASAASSFGVQITGIDPAKEKKVIGLNKKVVEGGFLESKRKNQILVGKKLAARLNLKMRSKIILTFQDKKGEIIYLACRITGIFKTESTTFDESTVFLKQKDLMRALQIKKPMIHEIAIRVKSPDFVNKVENNLAALLPGLKIESWKNLAPELAFISSSMEVFTYLFVSIILFALLFGITNNMLMSVMERIRELGILTAVGMKKSRIFIMILSETIMLSLTGGILGMVLGNITIDYFNETGIDLSAFAHGLENFGSGTMLYPFLPAPMYIGLTLMIFVAANFAAILPAWKATHLVPAEAIRTY